MILIYGNYAHPDNEANVSISRVGLEAEDGFVYGYTETWNITGILHGDTDADLFKAMNDLLDAYSLQGRDLIWKKGDTVMHQLLSQNTLTGTKVSTLPHFPKNTGGELTTFRTYNIVVEAEVPFVSFDAEADDFEPLILKFEENINRTGTGGPKVAFLPTLTGKYQKQQLTQSSTITIVQSGMKVGLGGYPIPNLPLWPDDEHQERRQINQAATRRRNGVDLEYPIHWSYTFERNNAFPVPKKVIT